MATLFIDRPGVALSKERSAIVLRNQEGEVRRVPMRVLNRVVVWGSACIDSGLLVALAERGIAVALHSGRGAGGNALVHGHGPHAGLLRLSQIRLIDDSSKRVAIATQIVKAKLVAQHRFIATLRQGRPDCRLILTRTMRDMSPILGQVDHAQTIPSLLGLEGAGAAAYWRGLSSVFAPGLGFAGRMRRPPPDPVNACLSLGYTCLINEAVSVCIAVGVDPAVGVLHSSVRRRPSLSCDLIEPLRTSWDREVYELFHNATLRADQFQKRPSGCVIGQAGRAVLYPHIAKSLKVSRRWIRKQLYLAIERSGLERAQEVCHATPSEDMRDHDEEFDN